MVAFFRNSFLFVVSKILKGAIIMQTVDHTKKGWSVKDVIFLAIIAIFFGIIYQVWSFAYYAIAATPLKPYANDLTLGVWIMAGPLAGVLLKKVGASVVGELLAAAVEMLLFSSWGASTLISGFIQGIGNELGFAATGYKNWGRLGLLLSAIGSTIITFVWDWFQSGYSEYHVGLLVSLFVIRFVSIGFFSGVLVYWIKKLVNRSGLIK
ncbi:ABC transporter permease [Liquorilactobacillus mali KCTC 3596 = DSM 20444]|uniref:ABC transporter permease n=2 Tax=Liquorilactobacillus mali TaxID=1618 RepID=A0A0R2E2K3_9LACO|nr:ABC transporter permease [Liquorilactobacillus mali KCTC 3596 = DSM 20444]